MATGDILDVGQTLFNPGWLLNEGAVATCEKAADESKSKLVVVGTTVLSKADLFNCWLLRLDMLRWQGAAAGSARGLR